jgi:uroporphyrinogen decarboxylase
LAAEITVQAVERLGVDAAMVFADILLIVEPLGVGLEYVKDNGPQIGRPVHCAADVDRLKEFDAAAELSFVYEAVRRSCAALSGKVPLIGFSGAPFTLASYLIEGGSSRSFLRTKQFIYSNPEAWRALMERLVPLIVTYLNSQIAAGAEAVQIFDSWVGCLSPEDYRRFVLPHTRAAISGIKNGVPVIHFTTGSTGLLKEIRTAGGDVIGLDWRVDLDKGWEAVGHAVGVQGNLDPAALLAPPAEIRGRVAEILQRAAARPGHIFNLGHGVLPETPVEHAIEMVDAVHELSAR